MTNNEWMNDVLAELNRDNPGTPVEGVAFGWLDTDGHAFFKVTDDHLNLIPEAIEAVMQARSEATGLPLAKPDRAVAVMTLTVNDAIVRIGRSRDENSKPIHTWFEGSDMANDLRHTMDNELPYAGLLQLKAGYTFEVLDRL